MTTIWTKRERNALSSTGSYRTPQKPASRHSTPLQVELPSVPEEDVSVSSSSRSSGNSRPAFRSAGGQREKIKIENPPETSRSNTPADSTEVLTRTTPERSKLERCLNTEGRVWGGISDGEDGVVSPQVLLKHLLLQLHSLLKSLAGLQPGLQTQKRPHVSWPKRGGRPGYNGRERRRSGSNERRLKGNKHVNTSVLKCRSDRPLRRSYPNFWHVQAESWRAGAQEGGGARTTAGRGSASHRGEEEKGGRGAETSWRRKSSGYEGSRSSAETGGK